MSLFMTLAASGHAQDSTFVSIKNKALWDTVFHSTPKAALYSAALPGLGQIYNRKIWKVPLVYAGFVTLGYFVYFNGTHYVQYRNAYLDFTDENPGTISYLNLISPDIDPATYDNVLHPDTYNKANRDWIESQLKRGLKYYKRYRDMSMIGIAGWYILNILDAIVDAQLFDYDISPDLSMKIIPAGGYTLYGSVPGVTCRFTF